MTDDTIDTTAGTTTAEVARPSRAADVAVPLAPRPKVTVVGLGPAGADLVTTGTQAVIEAHPRSSRYMRTDRHPAAVVMGDATTFDHVYDQSESLHHVYERIVELLVAAAIESGAVIYAVPGSPMVAEHTVELLLIDDRIQVSVLPALSFLDLAWARLGVDPVACGARVIDGHRFAIEAAGERGPLLVAQCDSIDVLSNVKLTIAEALETRSALGSGLARRAGGDRGVGVLADDLRVTVVQRLGLADEAVFEVPWSDLDRRVDPDHLTSLWLPEFVAPIAAEVQRFAELVATLRNECPWDREQTHDSLKRHLLEEAYEVLDAIEHVDVEAGTGYEHLEEELGDLLFQVLFHATLATEAGQFTLADVARTVHDKLYSRHPHVFADVDAGSADQVAANWEDLKKTEKGRTSIFDGIPEALPALLFALKVQKKADALALGSTVGGGRDATTASAAPMTATAAAAPTTAAATRSAAMPVARSLDDAVSSIASRAEDGDAADVVGELLFVMVATARDLGVDPESALRAAASKFRDAAKAIEAAGG